ELVIIGNAVRDGDTVGRVGARSIDEVRNKLLVLRQCRRNYRQGAQHDTQRDPDFFFTHGLPCGRWGSTSVLQQSPPSVRATTRWRGVIHSATNDLVRSGYSPALRPRLRCLCWVGPGPAQRYTIRSPTSRSVARRTRSGSSPRFVSSPPEGPSRP